jgi:hypothetical protein
MASAIQRLQAIGAADHHHALLRRVPRVGLHVTALAAGIGIGQQPMSGMQSAGTHIKYQIKTIT